MKQVIADLRYCQNYPANSYAAAQTALEDGFEHLLVEPLLIREEDNTIGIYLGDATPQDRARLLISHYTSWDEGWLPIVPEPAQTLLDDSRLVRLWLLIQNEKDLVVMDPLPNLRGGKLGVATLTPDLHWMGNPWLAPHSKASDLWVSSIWHLLQSHPNKWGGFLGAHYFRLGYIQPYT